MRPLELIAADFRAHRSVERDELVRLHRGETAIALFLTKADFDRLEGLLRIDTSSTVLYGVKKVLPKH